MKGPTGRLWPKGGGKEAGRWLCACPTQLPGRAPTAKALVFLWDSCGLRIPPSLEGAKNVNCLVLGACQDFMAEGAGGLVFLSHTMAWAQPTGWRGPSQEPQTRHTPEPPTSHGEPTPPTAGAVTDPRRRSPSSPVFPPPAPDDRLCVIMWGSSSDSRLRPDPAGSLGHACPEVTARLSLPSPLLPKWRTSPSYASPGACGVMDTPGSGRTLLSRKWS